MRKPAENAALMGGLIWIAIIIAIYSVSRGVQWLMHHL